MSGIYEPHPYDDCFCGWTHAQWATALSLHAELTGLPIRATEDHLCNVQVWWHTEFLDEPLRGAMGVWDGSTSPYRSLAQQATKVLFTAAKLSYWGNADDDLQKKACQILSVPEHEQKQLLGEDDD